jgi:hypothetical protein
MDIIELDVDDVLDAVIEFARFFVRGRGGPRAETNGYQSPDRKTDDTPHVRFPPIRARWTGAIGAGWGTYASIVTDKGRGYCRFVTTPTPYAADPASLIPARATSTNRAAPVRDALPGASLSGGSGLPDRPI